MTKDETITGALDALARMDSAWEHLACSEADDLAAFMAAHGRAEDAAEMLAIYHVDGDDHGDPHAAIKYLNADEVNAETGEGPAPIERPNTDQMVEAAREYVAGLGVDQPAEAPTSDPETLSDAEVLTLAIFAMNTALYPESSSGADIEELEAKADRAIERLAEMREAASA
ncbi:hypothetical protein [Cellulomonas sp. SG140]|uniref:hypothetical protein n=1 Tax=Cellulomonas sp. SG140 TaxID=2976536 RepID=UPI0021E7D4E1|nr:hypothetical protein [Cellulomonas sp. SG140]